jgi:hypothetical protein
MRVAGGTPPGAITVSRVGERRVLTRRRLSKIAHSKPAVSPGEDAKDGRDRSRRGRLLRRVDVRVPHAERARRLSSTVPSPVTAVYAIRSTMTALGADIGAKLQRAVAWIRLHSLDDHRSCAHGAKRSRHSRQPFFRGHVIPLFVGQIDQANAMYAARATIKATRNAGTTIGGTNQLVTLARSGRPGEPPSYSHLAIAAAGGALLSERFAMPLYGYDNRE